MKYECSGAIYAYLNNTVEISNAEISNNTSKRRGGAIYLAYDGKNSVEHNGELSLTDVTIKGNTASNAAGAIFATHGWDVEIDGAATEISGNTAGANGGAIVTGQYVNITMKAGTISGNTANGATSDGAGAIYFYGTASALTTFTMSGGIIKDNVDNSDLQGFALYGEYFYTYEGGANELITVHTFDLDGNWIHSRNVLGYPDLEYREAEGMQVCNGKIYIGMPLLI